MRKIWSIVALGASLIAAGPATAQSWSEQVHGRGMGSRPCILTPGVISSMSSGFSATCSTWGEQTGWYERWEALMK